MLVDHPKLGMDTPWVELLDGESSEGHEGDRQASREEFRLDDSRES